MKFEEYQKKLDKLKLLIEHANTGTPKELAETLHVSERTVRRLVERLKVENGSIYFCRSTNSYLLKKN